MGNWCVGRKPGRLWTKITFCFFSTDYSIRIILINVVYSLILLVNKFNLNTQEVKSPSTQDKCFPLRIKPITGLLFWQGS
jgi:hypothetical protein